MGAVIGDLDELVSLVRRSSRQEALHVEADARRRAQQVETGAEVEAERVHAEILAAAGADMADERRRLLAQSSLEAKRQHLLAREALLDEVWAEAERHLRELPGSPHYAEVLRRLAVMAADVLTGMDVRTSQPDRVVVLASDTEGHGLLIAARLAEWSEAAGVRFERADEPADIWGGLMAWDGAARCRVDASFATRLALARRELREQVAEALQIR